MPEISRFQMEQRRTNRILEEEIEKAVNSKEYSKLFPHSLELIDHDTFQKQMCVYCFKEKNIGELTKKYCKERSIKEAKINGTFNPKYKENI